MFLKELLARRRPTSEFKEKTVCMFSKEFVRKF